VTRRGQVTGLAGQELPLTLSPRAASVH